MSKTTSSQREHTRSRQYVVGGKRPCHLQHKSVDNPRKIFENHPLLLTNTPGGLIFSQHHVVTLHLLASRSLHFDNVNHVNKPGFESELS